MIKTLTIKSWGTRSHFVRKDSGEQPFYAPAFFVMKYLLILLLLASCSKETSFEGCIETTTMSWMGQNMSVTERRVPQREVNDTTYTVGFQRPVTITIKTICHE